MKTLWNVIALAVLLVLTGTAQPQSGTISAVDGAVYINGIGNNSTATIQITGTFVAELHFEASVDGVTWVPIAVVPPGTTGARTILTTGAGIFQANVAGYLRARVRASEYTSGTATVKIRLTTATTPFGTVAAVRSRDLLWTESRTVWLTKRERRALLAG